MSVRVQRGPRRAQHDGSSVREPKVDRRLKAAGDGRQARRSGLEPGQPRRRRRGGEDVGLGDRVARLVAGAVEVLSAGIDAVGVDAERRVVVELFDTHRVSVEAEAVPVTHRIVGIRAADEDVVRLLVDVVVVDVDDVVDGDSEPSLADRIEDDPRVEAPVVHDPQPDAVRPERVERVAAERGAGGLVEDLDVAVDHLDDVIRPDRTHRVGRDEPTAADRAEQLAQLDVESERGNVGDGRRCLGRRTRLRPGGLCGLGSGDRARLRTRGRLPVVVTRRRRHRGCGSPRLRRRRRRRAGHSGRDEQHRRARTSPPSTKPPIDRPASTASTPQHHSLGSEPRAVNRLRVNASNPLAGPARYRSKPVDLTGQERTRRSRWRRSDRRSAGRTHRPTRRRHPPPGRRHRSPVTRAMVRNSGCCRN